MAVCCAKRELSRLNKTERLPKQDTYTGLITSTQFNHGPASTGV
jgi:hypothetical protein